MKKIDTVSKEEVLTNIIHTNDGLKIGGKFAVWRNKLCANQFRPANGVILKNLNTGDYDVYTFNN